MTDIKYETGNHLIAGATPVNGGVNFTLYPERNLINKADSDNEAIELILYKKGTRRKAAAITLTDVFLFGGVYSVMVFADPEKYDYSYMYKGGHVKDIYAKIVRSNGTYGIHKNTSAGVPLMKKNLSFDEGLIYKLHVRGFTRDISSGVKNPGTFAGLAEKLGYLKDLGVSAIELMPAYDFERNMTGSARIAKSPHKINYWGYCGGYYFAPSEWYASGDNPIAEFKQMVAAAHAMDIGVIMEFYFVPGTGAGFIIDCLRYWALEFGIDGVHVNPEVAPVQLILEDDILSDLRIVSYSYMGTCDKRTAVCNDSFMNTARRFVKGDEGVIWAIIEKFSEKRDDMGLINYLAAQGTMSVMDMVSYDRKHNENNGENNRDGADCNNSWNCGVEGATRKKKVNELRIKQIKNAFMLLFMSSGIPMIYSGDEMGHTCLGNNNPYCQDNAVSWINYENIAKNRQIYDFVTLLAGFRRENALSDYTVSFHGREPWNPENTYGVRCFGVMYMLDKKGGSDKRPSRIYVMYNMSSEAFVMDIPVMNDSDEWEVYLCTDTSQNVSIDVKKRRRSVTVPERSSVLLLEKSDDEKYI